MKFFDNYESVINCDTIKVRELIICVCNSCNKEYKTTKDSVRKKISKLFVIVVKENLQTLKDMDVKL